MAKKYIALGMALVMCLWIFSACGSKNLTEEEHIQRITERVEKRFLGSDSEYSGLYSSFTVEMLYNFKDEPVYFMVEFEPDGFIYGRIYKNKYYYSNATFFEGSKWEDERSIYGRVSGWYTTHETYLPSGELKETREWHFKSHFCFAGITAERKYLYVGINIKSGGASGIYPAIKRDGIFIDVISGKESLLNQIVRDRFSMKARRTWVQL